MPRQRQPRSRSVHDSDDSRYPSVSETSSFRSSAWTRSSPTDAVFCCASLCRKDRHRKPLSLCGVRVVTFVVDPRCFHVGRTGCGQPITPYVVTVAHHQTVPVLVEMISEMIDIGGDFGVQGGGEYLAGAIAHDLIEQRTPIGRDTRVG